MGIRNLLMGRRTNGKYFCEYPRCLRQGKAFPSTSHDKCQLEIDGHKGCCHGCYLKFSGWAERNSDRNRRVGDSLVTYFWFILVLQKSPADSPPKGADDELEKPQVLITLEAIISHVQFIRKKTKKRRKKRKQKKRKKKRKQRKKKRKYRKKKKTRWHTWRLSKG